MKLKHIFIFLLFVSSYALYAGELYGRGASFPAKIYADWIAAYEESTGIQVKYDPTGSGDGIVSIKKRKCDFSGSDKPLKPWRLRRYGLSMFPAIIGSIVLAYNIPGVEDNQLRLSEEAIAAIFSGEAKYWDDPVIVKHNADLNLSHEPIRVVVRKDGSGTTYNFTYYLRKIDYEHFKKASKLPDWKVDAIRSKGGSGVAKSIQETEYSIGYVDNGKKQSKNLTAATIQNKEGYWVQPTLQACKDGAKYGKLHKENDFYTILAYPKGKTSYPLIATSFILLPDENKESNEKVIKFYEWALQNGGEMAAKRGYAALPQSTVEEIKKYWENRELK